MSPGTKGQIVAIAEIRKIAKILRETSDTANKVANVLENKESTEEELLKSCSDLETHTIELILVLIRRWHYLLNGYLAIINE